MLGGSISLTIFLIVNMFVLGVVVALAYTHARAHFRSEHEPKKRTTLPVLPHDMQKRILEDAEDDYERVLRKSAVAFGKDLQSTTADLTRQLSEISGHIMDDELARYKASLASLHDETEKKIGSSSAEIDSHQADLRTKLAERQAAMDRQLAEHQHELETKLAERSAELEREFTELQSDYAKKQAALEAGIVEQETKLSASLREREAQLAEHQAALEQELVGRQQAFSAKQAALEARLDEEMTKRRDAYVTQLNTKLNDTVTAFLTETLGQHIDLGAQTPYLISQLEAHKDELIEEIRRDA